MLKCAFVNSLSKQLKDLLSAQQTTWLNQQMFLVKLSVDNCLKERSKETLQISKVNSLMINSYQHFLFIYISSAKPALSWTNAITILAPEERQIHFKKGLNLLWITSCPIWEIIGYPTSRSGDTGWSVYCTCSSHPLLVNYHSVFWTTHLPITGCSQLWCRAILHWWRSC